MSIESVIAMFAIAFAAWAGVVGFSARAFLKRQDTIESAIVKSSERADAHKIMIERRLTRIETLLKLKHPPDHYPPETD